MCVSIEIDGEKVEDMEALIEKVGVDNVINQDGSPPEENDEFCLCGVDIIATAERAGYVAIRENYGFDYSFAPIVRQ